ncbi:amidase [Streptomyces sp. NBC_01803]|uniref:amidase n=1 Tax=Streptomyces sp. NBC_01803 TaxID=2975946 RepID=UPI002DD9E0E8|nr:amidase [Streptomyces sp. NBC_01803]WSA43665.1 amidase [Streptomyces sp. NBC_01803]
MAQAPSAHTATAATAATTSGATAVDELTLQLLREDLEQHRTTCAEVIRAVLSRIEALDQAGPQLNAVITVNPEALSLAEELDEEFATTGRLRAAHGVPVIIKDTIDTASLPTTGGSQLFADFYPENDATVVKKLRDAGAIIVAKANLDDFAAAVYGISSLTGAMPNPYGTDYSVGGSSGGCASAVASGYVPLAIGSDAGGSLRIPAAFTSIVTLRPTIGLVSRDGAMPRGLTQDTLGPMARTVADAAAGLDLMAGFDPADSVTARGFDRTPQDGYVSFAKPRRLTHLRIGVIRTGLALFGRNDPSIVQLLDDAMADLVELKATIVELPGPDRGLLGAGSTITKESARDVDAYLASQHGTAPVSTFRELYDSGAYSSYAKEAFDREIQVDPASLGTDLQYQQILSARTALQDWVYGQMAIHELDAISYASAMKFPAKIGVEQGGVFTRLSENTGFPAISVPMGYGGDAGLPTGLEFLGRPFTEPLLISLAASYEKATRHRVAPELTS